MDHGITGRLRLWADQLSKSIAGSEKLGRAYIQFGDGTKVRFDLTAHRHVRHLLAIADGIDQELNERYALRPTDAGGVPLHLGDRVEQAGDYDEPGTGTVACLSLDRKLGWQVDVECEGRPCYSIIPCDLRHHRPTAAERLRGWANRHLEVDGVTELSEWPGGFRIYPEPPSFHVGYGIPWWPEVDPADLIERAQDEAYDYAGEYADGWLDDVTTEESADLDRRIQGEFDAWLHETRHEPGFFMIGWSREVKPAYELGAGGEARAPEGAGR